VKKTVVLPCPPTRAFTLFTAEISAWWPPDRRHTKDAASVITLSEAGRFWERSRAGVEVELGRVREWREGERLVLDFYPGTDPDHPTEVVVTFTADPAGTRVAVEHRPLPASEAIWSERAPRFDASWNLVLEALSRAAA
jgi:hypothetical protein